MREIKFRAWDKKKKIIVSHSRLFRLDTSNELSFLPLLEKFTVDYEVMQYTGIKDKNDKEIYEGDIVKYLDGGYSYSEGGRDEWEEMNIGQIVYDEENAFYDVTNKNCLDREGVFESGGDFEVIGNIYEHPHLLEGVTNE